MRILIILKYIPSQINDRKADAITTTIKAHEAAGYDVVLLTTGREEEHNWEIIDGKPSSIYQKLAVKLIGIVSKKFAGKLRRALVINAVAKYHKSRRIDAVLAYCTSETPAILAASIKDSLNIPFVLREHKIYEGTIKTAEDLPQNYREALLKADKVLAVSPQLADIMTRVGVRNDVGCLSNFISNKFFEPPQKPNLFTEWAGNEFVFAGWTRWREFKRLDLLIKAFSNINKERPNTKLIIAGKVESSTQEKEILELIDVNDLNPYIWLYGSATREEIHQLAYACDCCVVPSDYETFGLPVIEAMAAGRPVIATRCGGPESIIISNALGRIVEKGDANRLAEAMKEVIDNNEDFDAKYIKHYVYKNYSEETFKTKLYELYHEFQEG